MAGFLRGIFDRWRGTSAPSEAGRDPEPLDRTDTAERIEILAKGGFETAASTVEAIAQEYLLPEDIGPSDRLWIEEAVARAFERKRAEEAGWPAETDFDRLARAFDELDANGIIALHCAGYTRSDGIDDAVEVYDERKAQGSEARGFVFYHGQDVEAVLIDQGLYLAFGGFDDRDETARSIAGEIVAAVERHGLATKWEGDVGRRILVWPIHWLKRSPADV